MRWPTFRMEENELSWSSNKQIKKFAKTSKPIIRFAYNICTKMTTFDELKCAYFSYFIAILLNHILFALPIQLHSYESLSHRNSIWSALWIIISNEYTVLIWKSFQLAVKVAQLGNLYLSKLAKFWTHYFERYMQRHQGILTLNYDW